jgi:hypothetical protein
MQEEDSMKIHRIAGTALALALSAAFLTAQAASTETKPKPAEKPKAAAADDKSKAAPAAGADEKAMMEAMAKASTPGEPHKQLAAMAGTWDAKVKMWMKPGDPPSESSGTATRTSILGGRYLEEKFDGTFMGQPFSGEGVTGYDNVTKKYMGTWADTMSTGIMTTTGSMDKGGKSMTMKGTMVDPMTMKSSAFREKITMTDTDHQTFEMWGAGPDGKTYKMMEITYSRKK